MMLAGMLLAAGLSASAQESAYAYDANGNLTRDLNKNIVDIQYNYLNLPNRVLFKNGTTFQTYTVLTELSCVRCKLLAEIR